MHPNVLNNQKFPFFLLINLPGPVRSLSPSLPFDFCQRLFNICIMCFYSAEMIEMEFLGHVCRRRGLEFLSLTGKVEGKRDRGKQRITFLDSLCNSATGGQSKGLNFLKLSDDRDVWRGMIANVCSRSGT